MADHIVCRGSKLTIEFAVCADGNVPAMRFFDSLPQQDKRKLLVLFDRLAEFGQILNREKFKKIEGTNGLFEFKSFQIRMPGFYTTDGRFVITHGFRKKQDAISKAEIETAYEIRQQHLSRRARLSI
jgi:phage-related protein